MARNTRTTDGIRYREKDGLYEKRFYLNGKRYSVYGQSRKECKDAEISLRARLNNGTYKANNAVVLDKYVEEWKAVREKEIKPNTLRSYLSTYNKHISPVLGSVKVQKIERRQVQDMMRNISSKVSIHTANYCLLVIKMILRDAVRDGIISNNPAEDIKALKEQKSNKSDDSIHRALSNEELTIFFKYAEESIFCNVYKFILYTGMRPGEVCALQYKDIDYKNNCIHVSRTVTYDTEGKISTGTPKTYTSCRDVPLNENAKEILKRQQAYNKIIHNPILAIDGLVFPGAKGNLIRCSALDNGIKWILKRVSADGYIMERFGAHAFRDTFATIAVEQDVKPHVLQKILGHKSISITMDIYYKLPEKTKQEQMKKISFAV